MEQVQILEEAFLAERPRLMRWMLARTGDVLMAEDIVQESYLEAWRNRHKLQDASGVAKWLNAIAQNVYLRWLRQQGQRHSHESEWIESAVEPLAEYALEQSDLADLLDKAMELLPPETRAILLARYLEDEPQAKVARDLGISESAVAVRLHRGKLALRKVLDSEGQNSGEVWQDTRLWCMACGETYYRALFDSEKGELCLICPKCSPDPRFPTWGHSPHESLIGFKSIKVVHQRAKLLHFQEIAPALSKGRMLCHQCGREARIIPEMPDYVPVPKEHLGIHVLCEHCGVIDYTALSGIGSSSPQGIRFSKDNPRTRVLMPETLNYQGREAVVSRMESVNQEDVLEVIFAAGSYEILAIYRNGVLDTNES